MNIELRMAGTRLDGGASIRWPSGFGGTKRPCDGSCLGSFEHLLDQGEQDGDEPEE